METGHFWQINNIGTSQVYIERVRDHYVATVLAAPDLTAEGATVSEVTEKVRSLLAEKAPRSHEAR